MVTEAVLGFLFSFVRSMVDMLPVFDFHLSTPLTGLIEVFQAVSYFMPMNVLGLCLGGWVVLSMSDSIYQVVMWIVRKVPGIS
ncbi:hypothetical protein DCMF_05190 [Candidatus Formimonas warabiya]|uniref:Uncharacterized protein n=2 Tax=Formimonas warabiya TaxID=1761012 RepID=A0A3G1KP55_FORW1|nr:hypothetical protein DCMF_05190 [Candidatus Formimonas warabiya]